MVKYNILSAEPTRCQAPLGGTRKDRSLASIGKTVHNAVTYCKALQSVGSHLLTFLQELDTRRLVLPTLFGGTLISELTPCFSRDVGYL